MISICGQLAVDGDKLTPVEIIPDSFCRLQYKKFEIKRLLFRSVSADFKSVNLKLERGIQKLFDSERLNIYKFWIAISVIKTVYTFRDASCTKIHKTTLNYIKPYLTSSNYTKLQQTTLNNT